MSTLNIPFLNIKKNHVEAILMSTHNIPFLSIKKKIILNYPKSAIIGFVPRNPPGRVAQSVGHLTRKSGVLGSKPCLATYFRFSFRFFKKGSCQLLAKVCARSTG